MQKTSRKTKLAHNSFSDLMLADAYSRIALVNKGLKFRIVDEAATALALPKAVLFRAIGLPASTISRRTKNRTRLSLVESDRVDRVAQTFKHALEVFGSKSMAQEWMSTRVPALGDCTPLQLLDCTAGYQIVLNTIECIAYGAPA